jgi:hypothetical protein
MLIRRSPQAVLGPVLVALALLATGCGSGSSPSSSESPSRRQTLVFVDYSISTGGHPQAESLYVDSLARIVDRRLRHPGDRLSLYYVHEKTLSKAHRLDVRNEVPPLKDKEFPDEQALARARHKRKTEQFLHRTTRRLQKALQSPPPSPSVSEWTDLWGTVGVATTELSPRADTHTVYYFSDMYESMPGAGRRNFDRRPPQSRAQAERWARADVPRLDSLMRVETTRLRNVRVRVLLGTLATKPRAQAVKFYWRTFFRELGVPPRQIDYN